MMTMATLHKRTTKAQYVALLWAAALLCVPQGVRCKMGIQPHARVHIIEGGVYIQFTVPDTAGNDFHGFDGHSMFAMSAAGGVRLDRASVLGSVTITGLSSRFDKDMSTESASEFRKGGGFITMCTGIGYSIPHQGRTELEPSLSYCWALHTARLDLLDRETNEILRPVDYRNRDQGIRTGLAARLWDRKVDGERGGNYPRLRLEYSFADVLGGMHVLDVEYKLVEFRRSPKYTMTESLLLVGELAMSAPAKYATVGIGVDIF